MRVQQSKQNIYRSARLSKTLQVRLSELIHAIAAESKMIASVSEVQVDKARKNATVWLSVLQGEDEKLLKLLELKQSALESNIFSLLSMPFRMKLHFQIDTGPRLAQNISELITKGRDR